MAGVSENGILCKEEFQQYKEQSVRAKFMNQIFLGIGGATVFGIVAAATTAMIATLKGATLATLFTGAYLAPTLGLAALAVVGVFSLYIGARYVAKSIMLDQDFQAKKIAHATRGMGPTMPEPEQGVSTTLIHAPMQMDQGDVADKKWSGKFSKAEPLQEWVAKLQAAHEPTMAKGA